MRYDSQSQTRVAASQQAAVVKAYTEKASREGRRGKRIEEGVTYSVRHWEGAKEKCFPRSGCVEGVILKGRVKQERGIH